MGQGTGAAIAHRGRHLRCDHYAELRVCPLRSHCSPGRGHRHWRCAVENALTDAGFGSQAQHEPLWAKSVFETAAFNRSATSPPQCLHELTGFGASIPAA